MQHRQATSRASIYYVHPGLCGGIAQWDRHLDRCGRMGFSHVLMAPPFRPGRSGNVLLTADFDSLNPVLGAGAGDGLAPLRAVADACHRRGLALWLDLILDRVALDSPLAVRQAHTERKADVLLASGERLAFDLDCDAGRQKLADVVRSGQAASVKTREFDFHATFLKLTGQAFE